MDLSGQMTYIHKDTCLICSIPLFVGVKTWGKKPKCSSAKKSGQLYKKITIPSHENLTHKKIFLTSFAAHTGYKCPVDGLELVVKNLNHFLSSPAQMTYIPIDIHFCS